MSIPVTIIFHIPENSDQAAFDLTLQSIQNLEGENFDCIALSTGETSLKIPKQFKDIQVVNRQNMTMGAWLNNAFTAASGRRIIYIDNRESTVILSQGALVIFQMAFDRNVNGGMVYGDYCIAEGDHGSRQDIRLLKHHQGRVRDNQDFGKTYFFRRGVLRQIGFLNPDLKVLPLYDLRLKISEVADIIHIGNRTGGHLYTVHHQSTSQNVFDYLLDDRTTQLEAEDILTDHLKRTGAYLPPSWNYHHRPTHPLTFARKASVIIPVNDRPEFIGTAIDSVQNQTLKDVEIIVVVNGGKADLTISEVKKYMRNGERYDASLPPVRLIVTDINNIGFCLNLGLEAAEGEYYVQLDSDDRLKECAVENIVTLFDSDSTIGMVIGSYDVWEKADDGSISRMDSIPTVKHEEWTEENGRNNLLRINGAGAPRSIPVALAKEMGLFGINEQPYSLNYGEDYDMVLRISERYRIGRIWEPIYDVIRHSGGTDHSIDQETIDRNDEAKDSMRKAAILRRKELSPPRSIIS